MTTAADVGISVVTLGLAAVVPPFIDGVFWKLWFVLSLLLVTLAAFETFGGGRGR